MKYYRWLVEIENTQLLLGEIDKDIKKFRKLKGVKDRLLVEKSSILNYIGHFESALTTLNVVDEKKINNLTRKMYLLNQIHALFFMGDYQKANQLLVNHSAFLSKDEKIITINSTVKFLFAVADYFNGSSDESQKQLEQCILQTDTSHKHLKENYFLGYILYNKGDNEEARLYFQHVIEHGRNSYYAKCAMEYLNE